jgi:Zn-finger nucleic acid-binding protein
MWFDRIALDDLATEMSAGIDTRIGETIATAEVARACPRCSAGMIRRQIQGIDDREVAIDIDVCEEHGIWFDHGEFEAVLEAVMAAADRQRSPWQRTERPWWVRAVQGLFDSLDSRPLGH